MLVCYTQGDLGEEGPAGFPGARGEKGTTGTDGLDGLPGEKVGRINKGYVSSQHAAAKENGIRTSDRYGLLVYVCMDGGQSRQIRN